MLMMGITMMGRIPMTQCSTARSVRQTVVYRTRFLLVHLIVACGHGKWCSLRADEVPSLLVTRETVLSLR